MTAVTTDTPVPEAEPTQPGLAVRLLAEVFGTFVLVLAITSVVLITSGGNMLMVALAAGLALMVGIVAVGHVSGGHFNPAVSLGFAIAGRMRWADLVPYIVAQVVGGLAGAGLTFVVLRSGFSGYLSSTGGSVKSMFGQVSNGFGEHGPLYTASQGGVSFSWEIVLLVEAVATAIFIGLILVAVKRFGAAAPFVIGLGLTVLVLITANVTGASLNPARSLATAFFADGWALGQVWVFWVGPLIGAALAGLIASFSTPVAAEADLEEDFEDEDDEDDETEVEFARTPDAASALPAVEETLPEVEETELEQTEAPNGQPEQR